MTTGTVSTQSAQPAAPEAAPRTDGVDKNAFLKLLVAQLQNQNPLSPADGATFVAQLAGFSQLEQSIAMRQDLEAIRKVLESSQTQQGDGKPPGDTNPPAAGPS